MNTPKEQPLKSPLAALYEELERHDWFYHFSDDHRVWTAGSAKENALTAKAKTIPGGLSLLDEYGKHVFSGQPWNTPKAPKPEKPN